MYTMKESVAVAKEADAKKGVSPTKSDNSILRIQNEPERQLGSLRDVIGNIRRDGGKLSVENIATELSGMPTGERAPALLALQQTHGNRYVQRVVSWIQAKLVVGQPGDIYEQEADRVAEQVMRMAEPEVQQQVEEEQEEEILATKPLVDQITPLVQRQVKEVEEEELLQAKSRKDAPYEVSHGLESQINAIKGGGRPLAESERAYFEPRFGVDFSRVRVHTGKEADILNQVLASRAFASGTHIFFRNGQYNPGISSGRSLLAHEIVHTVQANGKNPSSHSKVASSSAPVEREARSLASRIAEGKPTTISAKGDHSAIYRLEVDCEGAGIGSHGVARDNSNVRLRPTGGYFVDRRRVARATFSHSDTSANLTIRQNQAGTTGTIGLAISAHVSIDNGAGAADIEYDQQLNISWPGFQVADNGNISFQEGTLPIVVRGDLEYRGIGRWLGRWVPPFNLVMGQGPNQLRITTITPSEPETNSRQVQVTIAIESGAQHSTVAQLESGYEQTVATLPRTVQFTLTIVPTEIPQPEPEPEITLGTAQLLGVERMHVVRFEREGQEEPSDPGMESLFRWFNNTLHHSAREAVRRGRRQVMIYGYTSSTDTEVNNMQLSNDRAQRVRDSFLETIGQQVPGNLVLASGSGEYRAQATVGDDVPDEDCRRVEVRIWEGQGPDVASMPYESLGQ